MSRERKDQERATLKIPRGLHTQLRLHAIMVDETVQDVVIMALKTYLKAHKAEQDGAA